MKCFDSICTAMITPYNQKGIDISTLNSLIKRQIKQGVNTILVCGTTGEGALLSKKERENVIGNAVFSADDEANIVVGCGDITSCSVIDKCRAAYRLGAKSALVITPYYQKTDGKGVREFYLQIAESSPLPIIIYNVPSRTGFDIPIDAVIDLSTHENIVGIKQANGNITQTAGLLPYLCDNFALYCGDDALCLPFDCIGARGVISVASNIYPKMVAEALMGKPQAYYHLVMLSNILFSFPNPIPLKYIMYVLKLIPDYHMRCPLRKLTEQECCKMVEKLEQFEQYL